MAKPTRYGDRWRIIVDIGRDPVTGRRRRMSAIERTKNEAIAAGKKLRAEHGQHGPATKARTVGDLIEAWWSHHAPDLSPNTRRGYRSIIDQYLIPTLGELVLTKLTTERVDTLYRTMRREGAAGRPVKPGTVRNTHTVLSVACKQGIRWRWLTENPCALADPGRAERHEVDPPAIADILHVLENADLDLLDAIQLAIGTGARAGELCGLRWSDLDLDGAQLTFRRAVGSDENGAVVVIETRRKSKIRTISIDPATVTMLRARRARAAKRALSIGAGLTDDGYVLADRPGQRDPLPVSTISQQWRNAAARAGVPKRLHDIRHAHVTELLAAGIPVRQVAARVGHANPTMTLNVYAHAVERLDRAAADVIERALSQEA